MPKTKQTKSKPAKKKPEYELNIKVDDVDETYEADTIQEALEKFIDSPEFPFGAKTQAVFTISKGKESGVLTIPAIRARRLFLQFPEKDTSLEVFASTLSQRLNA